MTPRRAFAFVHLGRTLGNIERARNFRHDILAAHGDEKGIRSAWKELIGNGEDRH